MTSQDEKKMFIVLEGVHYRMSLQDGSLVITEKYDKQEGTPARNILDLIQMKLMTYSHRSIPLEQISSLQVTTERAPDIAGWKILLALAALIGVQWLTYLLSSTPETSPKIALIALLGVQAWTGYRWSLDRKNFKLTMILAGVLFVCIPASIESAYFSSEWVKEHIPGFLASLANFGREVRSIFPLLTFAATAYYFYKYIRNTSGFKTHHYFKIKSTGGSEISLWLENENASRGMELLEKIDSARLFYVQHLNRHPMGPVTPVVPTNPAA